MRIKKKFQGTIPENKIMDAFSTNNTDTYSCNYINQLTNKDMVKLSLSSAFEVSPTTYKHLPFGNKLSELNEHNTFVISSDGYVTINRDDIKKVRVYASTRIDDWSKVEQYLSIFLNGNCEKRTALAATQATQIETDILVKKGDVIDIRMYAYSTKKLSTDAIFSQFIVSVA